MARDAQVVSVGMAWVFHSSNFGEAARTETCPN